jgi:outer membrane protein
MNSHCRLAGFVALMMATAVAARAQAPAPADLGAAIYANASAQDQLTGPAGLRDYVKDGKLTLSLEDAIRLTLLNNTDVHINYSSVRSARYDVMSAYHPFDPAFTSSISDNRSKSPASNQLVGASTLNQLFQQAQFGVTQTLETGTNYNVSLSGTKSDTNSSFFFFNPYLTSDLSIQLTQPLLRNRGLFPNRAPIVIAKRNLTQSEETFDAEVNDSIQRAVFQYWNVVQARENLRVVQDSLNEADATYKQNKRALELGALPPLDIYRSESQVAQRKFAVIQAEYQLKQAEDQFRQVIGADLDPYVRALDLDLVEKPEPAGELYSMDAATALQEALSHRPELRALQDQLANDDTNIRLAHNGLRPDLEFSANYSSSGLGGNQLDSSTSPPTVIPGGLSDALGQTFHLRFPSYGVALTLNLPIRNRSAEATLGKSLVSQRRDLYSLRKEKENLTLEVADAVHQLEEAKLSIEAAKTAEDLAQKNVQAEQRKYELGVGQIFLVLEAQTELTQAQVNVVDAQIAYQMAVTSVEHATGGLLKQYQVQISQTYK